MPDSVKGFFKVYEDVKNVSLMLKIFLYQIETVSTSRSVDINTFLMLAARVAASQSFKLSAANLLSFYFQLTFKASL